MSDILTSVLHQHAGGREVGQRVSSGRARSESLHILDVRTHGCHARTEPLVRTSYALPEDEM